ncbi:MAG: response regulator [Deltaproteobacteria bacterium]|nr:response regulator [Deltaproteobacteria bacterium]
MSISGSLKVKKLVNLLKELRRKKATGVLNIKSYYGMGSVTLIEGKAAMAHSSKSAGKIGRKVVEKGLVSEVQIHQALKFQKEKDKGAHLGDVLVNMGFIDHIDLENLILNQIKETIYGMSFWEDGFFRFDTDIDKSAPADILLDPNILADDEVERFLKESQTGADPEKSDKKKEKESIKGEITRRIENISDKLRSFKPKQIILLVEDEMLMRQIITDKLSQFGFVIESVPTPKEALEKLAAYEESGISPIVITDLVMPTMSGKGMFGGMELLERIQEDYSHIPVIMTTAYPDQGTKQKALFWGVYYYISKPDRGKAAPHELDGLFNNYMEELSLSIENIIRRREVYFEKDHLDIIRNDLVEELFSTKLELSEVEKTMENKVGDLGFLKETSDILIKEQNVNTVSKSILNYASKELDRAIILLAKKGEYIAYKGISKAPAPGAGEFDKRLTAISIPSGEIDIVEKVTKDKKPYEGRVDPSLLPFIKKMGNEIPEKIIILPMIVEGKVVGLLYGDTLPGTLPCRNVDAVMILLNLASLSLEISHLKNVLSKIPSD